MVLTGHCLCGQVTYTVDMDAPLLSGYDHCDDCQRQSGSTYCQSTLVRCLARALSDGVRTGGTHASLTTNLNRGCLLIAIPRNIALVFVCLKDKVKIEGPKKSWAGMGSSGKAVHRIFCGECGSPIAHDPDAAPEIIAMKGGTLDKELKKKLTPVRAERDLDPLQSG
jgi:hypothetical protein